LAYFKINYLTPIYLEYAPEGTLPEAEVAEDEEQEGQDDVQDR